MSSRRFALTYTRYSWRMAKDVLQPFYYESLYQELEEQNKWDEIFLLPVPTLFFFNGDPMSDLGGGRWTLWRRFDKRQGE